MSYELLSILWDWLQFVISKVAFLIPSLIAAWVAIKVSRSTVRVSVEQEPPVLKRMKASWDLYHQMKEAQEFSEITADLELRIENEHQSLRWENEVLEYTSYGSDEQKILLNVSPKIPNSIQVAEYPKFKITKDFEWFVSGLMIILLAVMNLGVVLICIMSLALFLGYLLYGSFLALIYLFIAFFSFFLFIILGAATQKIVSIHNDDAGSVKAQIIFEQIVEKRIGHAINIQRNDAEKIQVLRASIDDIQIQELFFPDSNWRSSNKKWSSGFHKLTFASWVFIATFLSNLGISNVLSRLYLSAKYKS